MVTREGVYGLGEATFEEGKIAKGAGWWFHSLGCRSGCKACAVGVPFKMRWTDDSARVIFLVEDAEAQGHQVEIGDEALLEQVAAWRAGAATAPVAPEPRRAAVHKAMQRLAEHKAPGVGFNRYDEGLGLRLAGAQRLTDAQVVVGAKLAHRYRRQLSAELLEAIEQVNTPTEGST